MDSHAPSRPSPNTVPFLVLAGLIMAYGWGYRGIVGHEGGAMVPGALLGMALCLASGREDWVRRTAIAGLFGAVGWAWGGSMSYMEQTMYAVSDSFPDVLYGYGVLFLMGGLWAGIGGAVLGLAFTLPRSALQRLAAPFTAIATAFLLVYLYLFLNSDAKDVYERYVAQHFHDGDFFATVIACGVSLVYAAVRKQERQEALLFTGICAAWFVGYLGLTKFGGFQLAPPYRSESWGGVLGILVALIIYLVRTRNRASLLLACYGILGGGLAFSVAVFIRHPVRVGWGPFASWGGAMQWKIAEESFGLLMGLAIALGALRLLRGGLVPAEEDTPRKHLDCYAVFVVLVALLWMNVRRTPMRWMGRYDAIHQEPVMGLPPWGWYVVFGLILTGLGLQALRRYHQGELAIAPATALGKGTFVLFFLLWATLTTGFIMDLPAARQGGHPLVEITFLAFAGAATAMVLAIRPPATSTGSRRSDDTHWRLPRAFYVTGCLAPVVLLTITLLSLGMQEGAAPGSRLRFGPEAYWRDAMAVMGEWTVTGTSNQPEGEPDDPAPQELVSINFARDRSAIPTDADGNRVMDAHRWFHADSRIHLDWYGRSQEHPDAAAVVMRVADDKLYIPWPPKEGGGQFLVLERSP